MKKNLITKLLMLGGIMLMASSCKETVMLPDQNESAYNQVYMPQAVNGMVNKILEVKDGDQSFVYGANYGGAGYPENDIPVRFSADNALVNSYNTQNNTNYEPLPDGSYQLSAAASIIPKGSLATPPLKISVKTTGSNAIKMFRNYLLPVTVSADFKLNEKLKTTYFLISAQPNQADYPDYDRSAWKIVDFSSQEANGEGPNNGRAVFVIDNNIQSFWHSQWQGASPGPPHYITIDMGKVLTLHGVNFTARQVDGAGGKPQEVRIETSMDNINWKPASQFTLNAVKNQQKKWLTDFVDARYVKFIVLSSYSSSSVHLAEFGTY
ncbi:BT_3987 domain-containing protein [Pedobacter terrae]|uniref:BT_3987 domain-containing protein n=1 Tax=Pedobacter terrae TaxID=405671 RepID=UPI002FFADB7A